MKYLRQFPEFAEFHATGEREAPPGTPDVESEETPTETLERAQSELERALSAELLDRIHWGTPAFFERMVVDLLLAMGYGGSHEDAGKTLGRSGDGGVDGVINEDKLGLDVVLSRRSGGKTPLADPSSKPSLAASRECGRGKG